MRRVRQNAEYVDLPCCINLISDICESYNRQKAQGKAVPVLIYEVHKFILD